MRIKRPVKEPSRQLFASNSLKWLKNYREQIYDLTYTISNRKCKFISEYNTVIFILTKNFTFLILLTIHYIVILMNSVIFIIIIVVIIVI